MARRGLLRYGAMALLLIGVSACDTAMKGAEFPAITFKNQLPIALDVAGVDVTETYQGSIQPPHIEHRVPVSPSKVMHNWARDRLGAAGTGGNARFIILEASVTEVRLPKTGGLKGLITTDQEVRFTVVMKAKVEMENSGLTGSGVAEAEVSRSRTAKENQSLAERDEVLYALVKDTARDFDREMELSVRSHLGRFIKY